MNKISALIICFNEEKNIGKCLESVIWCDEKVVIDGFSVDDTPGIAQKYGAKVYQNEWKGFSEQRKFGLTKVSNEWIFSLDADERCSPELKDEILNLIVKNNLTEDAAGFEIPRKSFFLGKWIKHCGWYPDYQLRLFKKECAFVKDRLVHEGYEVKGKTAKLRCDIFHEAVNSISGYMIKINGYSGLSALEKKDRGNISYAGMLLRPAFEFIKKFIFQLGFLDGVQGLMVSYFHMITKILTYAKIREMQKGGKD
ncbi:MAG: hypothetical protein HGGPFJEG_00329 [Ignavibacteria bacterium]|nr:hypothetical protein [Ignavibacteria bacterium]